LPLYYIKIKKAKIANVDGKNLLLWQPTLKKKIG